MPPNNARYERALVWFRRDLRDFDHAALYHALKDARAVFCAFIFDREILDALLTRRDRRVEFIRESLVELHVALEQRGGALIVLHAHARDAIPQLATELGVDAVYVNHDYEPAATARDTAVAQKLAERRIAFHTAKDHVVFERDEVLSQAGKPFTVFTPYRNAWRKALTPYHLKPYPVAAYSGALARPTEPCNTGVPTLEAIGFAPTNLRDLGVASGMGGGAARFADFRERIDRYRAARDFPAVKGPSYLSVHLRFGTVSIRELAAFAHARSLEPQGEGAATWLSELISRDFYAQLLWHHPRVVGASFKPEYDGLAFRNDAGLFTAWCEGTTGYPLVDAAMRQLNTTGYMHNRLRMVTASFLVKDLAVDWRWGEKYFADKLIDFDLASNNGGWQWAASTGCDAQPWFRIFYPVTQSEKFDAGGAFIRRYVPELAAFSDQEIHEPWRVSPAIQHAKGVQIGRVYPAPIVDHAQARDATLQRYKIR